MAEEQEHELGRTLDALNATLHKQSGMLELLVKRVQYMSQVPVALVMICVASGFFYLGKLQNWEWLLACGFSMLPYYHEYLGTVAKFIGFWRSPSATTLSK